MRLVDTDDRFVQVTCNAGINGVTVYGSPLPFFTWNFEGIALTTSHNNLGVISLYDGQICDESGEITFETVSIDVSASFRNVRTEDVIELDIFHLVSDKVSLCTCIKVS